MPPTVELLAYQPAVCNDRTSNLQLLVRLHAQKPRTRNKPCLNLGLCIDRSGSMGGAPIKRALQAGRHLIESLSPRDYLSVVAFDDLIEVPTPCRQLGLDSASVIARLEALTARGGTALHQGWVEACGQVEKAVARGRLSRVLLFSDGQANSGLTDPSRIAAQVADWRRLGVTTTTIGLGEGYNEDLLSAMARAGNGSFYHVRTPEDIVSTFQVELQGMVSTYGQAVSLGVEPRNGVELLRVVNPLDSTPGGRYQLADLVHGCPIDVVVELLVPALEGQVDLCEFRLAWTELETGQRHHSMHSLRLPVVPQGQLSEFPLNLEVARKGALQASARCMREAIELLDRQDRDHAGKALRFGLQMLSEAGPHPELEDAARQFRRLLSDLERGAVGSARKEARSYSGSLSMGSVVLNSGFREFMALPAHERTQEKLNELMGFKPST